MVVCSFPHTVRAAGSKHEVRAKNRSLNAYFVTIKGTCETAEICYTGPSGNLSSWSDDMRVPSRPGRGGHGLRVSSSGLKSLGPSKGATVNLDLVAQLQGFPHSATDSISVQVDTA